MKKSKFNPRYVTAVAIASFAALVSACGSSGSSTAGAAGIGVGIGGVGSPCVPLSQQMSFSGYAGYVDSANLYAGTQPPGSPYAQYNSQLGLGQGGATSGNQFINTILPPVDGYAQRMTSDLTYMGLNLTSTGGYNSGYPTTGYPTTGYTGYPTTGAQSQTMIQGSFVFSSADWAYLTTAFQQYGSYGSTGGYYGSTYPTNYPATGLTTLQNVQACNIGINTGLYSWNTGQGQGTLYSGYIFMTINGQEVSFKI